MGGFAPPTTSARNAFVHVAGGPTHGIVEGEKRTVYSTPVGLDTTALTAP